MPRLPRVIMAALTVAFIFCGCQSAPTFGQSATVAPQPKPDGLIDSVVQGVSTLLNSGAAPASVPVASVPAAAVPAVTAAQVEEVSSLLKAMDGRLAQANQRAGQARNTGWIVVGVVGVVGALVALIALGYIGRAAPYSANERAVLAEVRRLRKRQAALAAAVAQLQEFVAQSNEDRDHFRGLLAAVGDELKKIEGGAADLAGKLPS